VYAFDYAAALEQTIVDRLARVPREPALPSRAARCSAAIVIRAALRAYNRLRIIGAAHLPLGRSFVIVANHASHLDTVCLQAALPLRLIHRTYPVAAADYFFDGAGLTHATRAARAARAAAATLITNALPFARSGASHVRASIAVCRDLLTNPAAGIVLIVYPEGTRSTSGAVGAFKRGIGELVAGRDVPVVPCFIDGARRAWPKGVRLPRPLRVRLTFGPPRTYAQVERCKQSAQAIADDLRRAVLDLGRSGRVAARAATLNEVSETNRMPVVSGSALI
jgi:1-acyl-sn-glycerol-3-phosphate acyltransferase